MDNAIPKPNVFEFSDYKAFVRSWIDSRPNGGRGEKSRLAQKAGCHLAYISQVLNGNSHFNLEQADALNEVFEHGEDEAHFLILLVEYGRAGTASLRRHFERRIQHQLNQRFQLQNRFSDKKTLTPENQAIYYSHWAYCAVHMAILNPTMRTPGTIAKYFDLGVPKVIEILDFLTSVGLAKVEGGEMLPGDVRIHLGHDSPMISKHHTNWRMRAITSLERATPQELHYSGVISVSHKDLPKIRESLVRALEQVRAIVKTSEDDTVYCYAVDFFGLGKVEKSN